MIYKNKSRSFIALFCIIALCSAGCGKTASESDIAGKIFVYEKEGFGSEFAIEIQEGGTYSYYEGALSSYLGSGKWELNGDILCLTGEGGLPGKPLVNYFKVKGKNLVFLSEKSSNFTYIDVTDGDKFLRKEPEP